MKHCRYRIGKAFISITRPDSAINSISAFAKQRSGGYICVSNIRMIRHAGAHPRYADLMKESLMNLPDGKPLEWCSKLWGIKNVQCTNGPSLFKSLIDDNNDGFKHYLLGDTQDVIDKITQSSLNTQVVGAESLPFVDVNKFDYRGIAERVKTSGANLVWTAMRAPKQDEFNQQLSKLCPNVICIGVGRAFRMYVGEVKEAPTWAKKLGIGGLFTRRVSFPKAIQWYIVSSFYLMGYALDIVWRRLCGKNYYE